jgi:two-component system, OmpR family, osmolarity sensor histidine kinase EnvZ
VRMVLPQGIVARLGLVLVVALAIEYAGNLALHKWQERALVSEARTRNIAEQLATAAQLAGHVEPGRRPGLMADLGIQGMTLNWVPATVITDSSPSHPELQRMRAQFERVAPDLAGDALRLSLITTAEGHRDLLGALRIGDRGFISFRVRPFLYPPPPFALIAGLHVLIIAAVAGVALLMMRTLIRPLRTLAEAADATGRGQSPDIRIEGPLEVRRVATAFRAMQGRLLRMMDDQTSALIALSHDLRTPIQRMRLRAALIADTEARDALKADLSDMEKFTKSVLDFISDGSQEPARKVDLAALVMTIVDNLADAGAEIDYHGPDSVAVTTRPLALKRALTNLADNAITHGSAVRIVLQTGTPNILTVEDDGPGISPERREEAFLPFRRLTAKPQTGGMGAGLGLAIARNAVASFDGSLRLDRSAMGGLAAIIEVPDAAGTV